MTNATKTEATTKFLHLGAVLDPHEGVFHGPAINAGSDGGELTVFECAKNDRVALIVIADEKAFLGTHQRVRDLLKSGGWEYDESRGFADDVASVQTWIEDPHEGEECASTGLIFSEGWVAGAWISTGHDLFVGDSAAYRATPL